MNTGELTQELDGIKPGFAVFLLSSPSNYGVSDSFGYVLSRMQVYLARDTTHRQWVALASFINAHVTGANSPLEIEICAKILERTAERGHPLEGLLSDQARKSWDDFT